MVCTDAYGLKNEGLGIMCSIRMSNGWDVLLLYLRCGFARGK